MSGRSRGEAPRRENRPWHRTIIRPIAEVFFRPPARCSAPRWLASTVRRSRLRLRRRGQKPPGEFAAPPIPDVRIGFVGVGGQGGAHVRNMLRVAGRPHHRDLRHQASACRAGPEVGGRRRPERAAALYARPARLRAAVPVRGRRSRLQCHAVGVARSGLRRGDEERQACRHRSAGGDDARRVLGARRARREARASTA